MLLLHKRRGWQYLFFRLAGSSPNPSLLIHKSSSSMDFFFTIAPAPSKVDEVDELPQVDEDSSTGSSGSCIVA
ncbi:hypothetical protein C8R44DRAFT_764585 [Mycena epipterygia]|nr:hypothetical protein C8R44DRAFT_764585 [Mycena epipterygia]